MLARTDALVVFCQSTLESIVHLREALPGLAVELRGRSLFVVPTGAAQFSAADIGRTLAVEVLPPMPDDPGAAAALANRRAVKRLERTRLLRWAGDTVQALGVDPISPVAVDPLAVPACLVAGHAPFCWGRDAHEAAHNAVVLEYCAKMAYNTLTLKAEADGVSLALLDRHYFRKHGPGKTYGQG